MMWYVNFKNVPCSYEEWLILNEHRKKIRDNNVHNARIQEKFKHLKTQPCRRSGYGINKSFNKKEEAVKYCEKIVNAKKAQCGELLFKFQFYDIYTRKNGWREKLGKK